MMTSHPTSVRPGTATDERTALLRAVAKAEALTEAACLFTGPVATELHRQAATHLRRAAQISPRIHPAPQGRS